MVELIDRGSIKVLFNSKDLNFYILDDEAFDLSRRLNKCTEYSGFEGNEDCAGLVTLFKEANTKDAGRVHLACDASGMCKVLNRLTVITTNACNLKCKYCYEDSNSGNEKMEYGHNCSITEEIAFNGMDQIFSAYSTVSNIMFFGGEPMLDCKMIRKICDYVIEKTRESKNTPKFGMITNGTLINDDALDLIKKYSINMTISTDGPRNIHDYLRPKKNGDGSCDDLERSARLLADNGVPFNIQCTFTMKHLEMGYGIRDLLLYFKGKYNIKIVHIVPVLGNIEGGRGWDAKHLKQAVDSYSMAVMMNLESIEKGRFDDVAFCSFSYGILQSLIRKTKQAVICNAGMEIAISPDGGYFPCFMLIDEKNENRLSTVEAGINDVYWGKVNDTITNGIKENRKECVDCWVKNICHGCLGGNYKIHGSMDVNDEVMCTVIKELCMTIIVSLAEIYSDDGRWKSFIEKITSFSRDNANIEC